MFLYSFKDGFLDYNYHAGANNTKLSFYSFCFIFAVYEAKWIKVQLQEN